MWGTVDIAIYGYSIYGEDIYGAQTSPEYRVDPFTATSIGYDTVGLSWSAPTGTVYAYRLIRNRYGYPVDQDDGEILIDSVNYPGSQYQDNSVIPGQYHYYGFYVQTNTAQDLWVRSAWTACLAINDYDTADELSILIPNYFENATNPEVELAPAPAPDDHSNENPVLNQFMQVFGWGFDLLKTQYDTYLHVNDPWSIPLSDLYNLAAELGLNINPDISAYTLRKAVYYNATINHYRGTPNGIASEVSALTGWDLDLQVGPNIMLSNDQSQFTDPQFEVWSPYLTYNVGEVVTYTGSITAFYQCTSTSNYGHSPAGNGTNNTWWNVYTNQPVTTLNNSVTGGVDTWEVLYPNLTNGTGPAGSMYESAGNLDPLGSGNLNSNLLVLENQEGTAQTMWLRSVARTTTDLLTTTTTFAPDKSQVIGDGIPIPYSLPSQVWSATTWYGTGDIVTYNNQPFIALRASYGETPPYATKGSYTTEWMPLSWEPRYRILSYAYASDTAAQVAVTPFMEWYDNQGNLITRILARNTSAGTAGTPNNLYFDSFTTGAGGTLSGRTTDDGNGTWIQEAGTFDLSTYATGCIYPASSTTRTYAVVNSGVSNTNLGLTFNTAPASGYNMGIVFRWSDDNDYFLAAQGQLLVKNSGTWSTIATYSTAMSPGDRMTVELSGTSLIVLRNGSQVASTTSAFNETATYHGISYEIA